MPPPAAAPGVTTGPVTWEALVDAYYLYNLTGDPSLQGPALRAFDTRSNSFTLSYAKVAAYMNADPVGFRIDLGYGHTGSIINTGASLPASGGLSATDVAPASLYGTAFFVQQAFATVKFDTLTIDAGKFVTSASDEVIETRPNWNYSRSLLFNGVPFVHTGLRLGLKVNDMVSLQASVVNGWNNDPDNNSNKTFGGQIALVPATGSSVILTTYIGKEAVDTQMLFDLIAAYTVSDTVGVSLNADFFKNGDAQWWGIAGKGRFILSDMFNLALRGEVLSTKDGGYAGPGSMGTTTLYEGTVTAAVPVRKNFEFRFEVRGDFASEDIFLKGMTPRGNQFTALVGFLAGLP
jgi:hypothetical protein